MQQEFITVTFNRTKIAIRCADILYVIMSDDHCRIHMFDGNVYRCRMTLKELKKQLNEEFIEVKRGCMLPIPSQGLQYRIPSHSSPCIEPQSDSGSNEEHMVEVLC